MTAKEARDLSDNSKIVSKELEPLFKSIKEAALQGKYVLIRPLNDAKVIFLRNLGFKVSYAYYGAGYGEEEPYRFFYMISW